MIQEENKIASVTVPFPLTEFLREIFCYKIKMVFRPKNWLQNINPLFRIHPNMRLPKSMQIKLGKLSCVFGRPSAFSRNESYNLKL